MEIRSFFNQNPHDSGNFFFRKDLCKLLIELFFGLWHSMRIVNNFVFHAIQGCLCPDFNTHVFGLKWYLPPKSKGACIPVPMPGA